MANDTTQSLSTDECKPYAICERNMCAKNGDTYNGICCQFSAGQQYCLCKAEYMGPRCQYPALDFEFDFQFAYREMMKVDMLKNNFTLLAIFLGVMAILLTALLGLLIYRLSGRKRAVNGSKREATLEDLDETEEGQDTVDGMIPLRQKSSRRTAYHSQTSHCCSPQHGMSIQCPLQQSRMSHCVIREGPTSPTFIGHCGCVASPTLICGCAGHVVSPTSPTMNGHCNGGMHGANPTSPTLNGHCNGGMNVASPTGLACNGQCGSGRQAVNATQSVPSQPDSAETE